MSLETKSKSFLIHEIGRLQMAINEKDIEIALLKEGAKNLLKQPAGTVIVPTDGEGTGIGTKAVKKRKFSFEREDE